MRTDDDIPEWECWRLLATASVGRIAVSARALPTVIPVQYHVDEGSLGICLGHFRLPGSSVHETVLAFQADSFDPETNSGWTVQVLGLSRLPGDECDQPAAGDVIRLSPELVEGHRVRMCPLLNRNLIPPT